MEIRVYNPKTREIVIQEVDDVPVSIDDLKSSMLSSLSNLYQDILNRGFSSSASGSPIFYGYDPNYQLIYSKWANVLALDPTRASVSFSTPNGTLVTLTRDQFMKFMNDAETFELNLFNNRMNLEANISNATTVDELNVINIAL